MRLLRLCPSSNRLRPERRLESRNRAALSRSRLRSRTSRKYGRRRPPVGKTLSPDQVRRTQVAEFQELAHLRIGQRTELLSVPGKIPFDLWSGARHQASLSIQT